MTTWAYDPATVAEVVHEGSNADTHHGEVAYCCDHGLAIYAFAGGKTLTVDLGDDSRRH